MNSPKWSRALSYFGNTLAIASLVFIGIKLKDSIHTLPPIRWDIGSISSIAFSLIFWTAAFALTVFAWRLLLGKYSNALSYRDAFIVLGRSQIAKYLPGNVFHYVGRVTLGAQKGLPSKAIILSAGTEAVLDTATVSFFTVVSVLINPAAIPLISSYMPLGVRLMVIVSLLLVALCGFLLFRKRIIPWFAEHREYFHAGRVVPVLLIYMAVFLFVGIMMVVLLGGLWGVQTDVPWYQLSFGFAIAWLIGFVTPGAAGGIGIREAVFVALFGSQLGEGIAVGIIIAVRIVTIISDVVNFGIAVGLERGENVK